MVYNKSNSYFHAWKLDLFPIFKEYIFFLIIGIFNAFKGIKSKQKSVKIMYKFF